MGRMLSCFFYLYIYSLIITGEIKNIPEKIFPQTLKNLKEISSNIKPILNSQKTSNNSQKNLRQALQGYSDQEIQRMLEIASGL